VNFVGTLLVFGGYVLVYAAVARGGRFATEPWAGLYEDAYTGDQTSLSPLAPSRAGMPPGYVDIGGYAVSAGGAASPH
jgi:hypothetical protein